MSKFTYIDWCLLNCIHLCTQFAVAALWICIKTVRLYCNHRVVEIIWQESTTILLWEKWKRLNFVKSLKKCQKTAKKYAKTVKKDHKSPWLTSSSVRLQSDESYNFRLVEISVLRWWFSAIKSLVKRASLAAGPSSTSDDDDCDVEFCIVKRKKWQREMSEQKRANIFIWKVLPRKKFIHLFLFN